MFFKRKKILVKHPAMNYYSFRWVKKFDYQKAVSVLLTVLLVFQIIGGVFLFVPSPKQAQAATQSWPFTTAGNYTYDNTKIEISSGQAQLKATGTPDWYDTNWGYRRAITIDNTGNASDLTNYQVKIELTPSNFDYSNASSTGADIRFTDTNGTTTIDFWIEEWDNTATSTLWVEVPSISASSSKTIYMYYGNSGASSASNGDNTFLFFDDDFDLITTVSTGLDNATTYQTTPTYDGSGQAIHPDIVYFANGWNGYKYWMAMTPYPGGNDDYENPSILASNDGSSWEVPTGLTNPLIGAPPCDHNNDTDMIYNSATDELWVYYQDTRRASRCSGYEAEPYYNHNYVKLFKSSDGVNWSGPTTVMDFDLDTDPLYLSPSIVRIDSTTWYLWTVDTNGNVKLYESSDGETWGSEQSVSISDNVWHLVFQTMFGI